MRCLPAVEQMSRERSGVGSARLGAPKQRDHHATGPEMKLRSLQAALIYAQSFAFAVFPCHWIRWGLCSCGDTHCKSPGKHPLTEHGCKDATQVAAQIRAWWRRWPNANVAIATGSRSGIVVVDVDPRHGGDQAFADLQ